MTTELLTVKLDKLTYGGDALGDSPTGALFLSLSPCRVKPYPFASSKKNPATFAPNWLRF